MWVGRLALKNFTEYFLFYSCFALLPASLSCLIQEKDASTLTNTELVKMESTQLTLTATDHSSDSSFGVTFLLEKDGQFSKDELTDPQILKEIGWTMLTVLEM